jgi:hypothetical protein
MRITTTVVLAIILPLAGCTDDDGPAGPLTGGDPNMPATGDGGDGDGRTDDEVPDADDLPPDGAGVIDLSDVSTEEFLALASSSPPFGGAISDTAGLVRIDYKTDPSGIDPEADENGIIHKSTHYCGDTAAGALEELADDIAFRLANPPSADPVFSCVDNVCSHAAALEFDVTGDYTFLDGTLRSVVFIEGGTVAEEFRVSGRIYADNALIYFAGTPCGE